MPAPHPRMHGLTHVPGGSDPIPSLALAGILFEIMNEGLWLSVETTDTSDGSPTGEGMRWIADVGDLAFYTLLRDIVFAAGRDVHMTTTRDFDVTSDRDVSLRAGRDVVIRAADGGMEGVDGNVLIAHLPTSDPGVTGAIWNDGGTLKVS